MRWIAGMVIGVLLAGSLGDVLTAQWVGNSTPGIGMAAEEEGGAAEPTGKTRGLWDSIKAGGVIGFTIILLSVAMLALVIQYTVEQKREKLIPPHVVAELEQLFEEQAYDEAAEMCQAEDNFLTRIVGGGLSKIEAGYDAAMKGAETAGDEETTKLFQQLSNLSLIAGIAPMMGLFGTVSGMIAAFNVIASTAGGASPAQLADGISEALVTTYEGLIVAIPCLACLHFLKARAIRICMEGQTIVGDLFERMRAPQA